MLRLGDARETHSLSVGANCIQNLKRQSQRAAAIFERNDRRGPLPYRTKKRLELGVQRFFGGNRKLRHSNLRIRGGISRRIPVMTHGEDQHLLASVVEGNVLLRLEKTQLAHPLGGDAGGRAARDAASLQ